MQLFSFVAKFILHLRGWLSLLFLSTWLSGCISSYHDKPVYDDLLIEQKKESSIVVRLQELPEYDPAEFVGKKKNEIITHLGKPDFLRRDLGKEFLQYRSKDCIIDLFVGQDAIVSYANLRSGGLENRVVPTILRQCLYLLVAQRSGVAQPNSQEIQ